MKNKIITFLIFCIGLIAGALLWNALAGVKQNEALDSYLITAIQGLARQTSDSREAYLKNTTLYNDISEFTQLSSKEKSYFWFTVSPDKAKEYGISLSVSNTGNFSGFYIVLTDDGGISDFGYHKP